MGTAYAQRVIWQHQHPSSCAAAKYLIYQPCHQGGIGSNIHVMGLALSHALTMGRVLMTMEDHAHPFYDGEHCGPAGYYDCYFEPVSNCTTGDMAALLGGAVVHADLPTMLSPKDDRPGAPVGLWLCNDAGQRAYPPVLAAFLEASPVHPAKRYYWWRAQSAAYLTRPNARTLADVAAKKAHIFPQVNRPRELSSEHRDFGNTAEAAFDERVPPPAPVRSVPLRGLPNRKQPVCCTRGPSRAAPSRCTCGAATSGPRRPTPRTSGAQRAQLHDKGTRTPGILRAGRQGFPARDRALPESAAGHFACLNALVVHIRPAQASMQ